MDLTTQVNAIARHLGINLKGQQEKAEKLTKEWIEKGWLVIRRNGLSPYVEWSKVGRKARGKEAPPPGGAYRSVR